MPFDGILLLKTFGPQYYIDFGQTIVNYTNDLSSAIKSSKTLCIKKIINKKMVIEEKKL